MIFADKLIALRKKEGWSQEELAQQLMFRGSPYPNGRARSPSPTLIKSSS